MDLATIDDLGEPSSNQIEDHPVAAHEWLIDREFKTITRYVPYLKELEASKKALEKKVAQLEATTIELQRQVSHTEGRRTVAIAIYNLGTICAVVGLAIILGFGSALVVPVLAILGGISAAQILIRGARTTQRGRVAKALFYAAGFILLLEVIIFINSLVSAAGK